jgi:23S rRNA (cytidine1920-2'-O)/16S rRNA (cytidine1409-2'-O)-methyltransferase
MDMRLDIYLVKNAHFPSRQRAQQAVKSGLVLVNGQAVSKPSHPVEPEDEITVTGDPLRYVSQGGLKLEKAIRHFNLNFSEKRILDAGASTGGFTDCALQHGATKIYAVDVGTSQLVEPLLTHSGVAVFENLDVRQITLDHLDNELVDFIVADLSFISLTHVLPAFFPLVKNGGQMVVLIKPQFEMENRKALKRGIVKDPKQRGNAVRRVVDCAENLGLKFIGKVETDVEDVRKKNVEYLAVFAKRG